MSITGWRFEPPDGVGLDTVRETTSTSTWAGKMLIGGHVTLSGSVAGVTASATLFTETVNARDTASFRYWQIDTVQVLNFPDSVPNPIHGVDLGYTLNLFGITDSMPPNDIIILSAGPNSGYKAFPMFPLKISWQTYVNGAQLREDTVSTQLWKRTSPGASAPTCTRSYIADSTSSGLRHDILSHEGKWFADTSHTHWDVAYTDSARARLLVNAEKLVIPTSVFGADSLFHLIAGLSQDSLGTLNKAYVDTHHPFNKCNLTGILPG
jgi:hypothetical protein